MFNILTNNMFDFSANALSTVQKLRGVSRWNGGNTGLANPRIFAAGLITIGILLVVLYLYRKNRKWKEEDISKDMFESNIERIGLNDTECQLVLDIAKYSRIKRIDSIFTMPFAFDQGAASVMKKSFSQGRTLVERKHLNHQITSLKEKLGFKKEASNYTANEYSFRPKGLSSRQVPVGRNVLISRIQSKDASPMTAVVVENNQYELKLSTEENFIGKPGEVWRVLYQFGAVIWKFDSLIVSFDNNELVLSHTENIRFINRRKFVHAPVNLHGYIARFHCANTVDDAGKDMLPQFISATVTELSGPALQIIAPLKVRTGERILVIFELSRSRVIQSTAEVRRCENGKKGYMIAAEMIDINEACINELITATNSAVRAMATKEDEEIRMKELEALQEKEAKEQEGDLVKYEVGTAEEMELLN